ncbi:hypothetical protein AAC387_Pa02g0048 [Persea americana]
MEEEMMNIIKAHQGSSLSSPIFYIFSILPFTFSLIHLRGISAFFLTWLANFKLLLFSLNLGPLTAPQALLHFIATASLPIKSKDDPVPDPSSGTHNEPVAPVSMGLRGLILGLVIYCYKYKAHMHEKLVLGLYCIHMYLALEVVLAMARAAARAMVGVALEPQFDEPYLSSSLQDF